MIKNVRKYYKKLWISIEKSPLKVFISLLALLILLIAGGNYFRKPKAEVVSTPVVKKVEVYTIGSVPKIGVSAQVEKSGVVQISSSTSGFVSKINVKEGQKVFKGASLLTLSNNYSGGNALSVGRQLAEKQNQLVETTYQSQKDIVAKQRDLANQSQTNFEKIRDITNQSVSDTQSLISFNADIIATLNTNIQNLSSDPVGNAALILSTKQMLSQYQSVNLQLNSALRSSQYQADTNNPPSKLSDQQKNLVFAQLDVQEKTLELNREMSGLQLKLARINEAMMYPSAPGNGIVEQVLVKSGQQVNPGTPLMVFSISNSQSAKAVVYLAKNLAENVSKTENTIFRIGGKEVSVLPSYVSTEATNSNLYAVIYFLPKTNYIDLTDKEYIAAEIPVGYPNTSSAFSYVPLDAVYQTQEEAFVYKVENDKAKSIKVELGEVFGSYVRVTSGLVTGDRVISDRNVIDGDAVSVK